MRFWVWNRNWNENGESFGDDVMREVPFAPWVIVIEDMSYFEMGDLTLGMSPLK